MNRVFFPAVLFALLMAFSALGAGHRQRKPVKFTSKQLVVTNIDPSSFHWDSTGAITAAGMPTFHATLPPRHMAMDAAKLTGQIDPASGVLKTATLGGAVHGSLDSAGKDGINHITFSGDRVDYKDEGSEADPASSLTVAAAFDLRSKNSTSGGAMSLHGSSGACGMRTLDGQLQLSTATVSGPVTFSFASVRVDAKGKRTPANGHGTAAHLKLSRTGTGGTDYEIHLTGGVKLEGSLTGYEGSAEADDITVIVDRAFNFKSLNTAGSASGKIAPARAAG